MGVRFRKSVKIAPGIKLNAGKNSAGISFGGKGAHVSTNTNGRTTTSIGAPGTGVSYVTQSGGSKKKSKGSGILAVVLAIFGIFAISSAFGGGNKEREIPQPVQSSRAEASTIEQKPLSSEEDNADKAREYLLDTFQLEMEEYKREGSRLYISVTIPGVSDREDQSEAPENWDRIQRTMISAQARLKEELKIKNIAFMLYLMDKEGEFMLTVQNSKITQDRYEVEPDPEEQTQVDSKPSVTYVWVTKSGKKYHFSSSCSGMNNPTSISIDSARAKGYTPCSKCA